MFESGDIVQVIVESSRTDYAGYKGFYGEHVKIIAGPYDDDSVLVSILNSGESAVMYIDEIAQLDFELPYDPKQMPDQEDDI
jgi:ribosomal protein L21E